MIHPEVDWLGKWAGYRPQKLALRDHAREREWTYGEANSRAQVLARHLRDGLGVSRGDRVAVLAQNCAETVFLFFACVKLGAILVPLNFRLTARELDQLLADCEPRVLFVGEAEIAVADALTAGPDSARPLPLGEVTPLLAGPAGTVAPGAWTADRPGRLDDAVMILYTAGTTGLPKGAIISHRMLLWNAVNTSLRLELTGRDHTQSYAPFFHTGGWHVLLTPFLHNGASTTLLERFDADLIVDLMQREETTLLFGVPTMMRMLSETDGFAAADFATCRYAIVGGAPMPLPLIDVWHRKGVLIRQGYGLTEVGPNCFSLDETLAVSKAGSIGLPNFYVAARVVDPDGRDCPDGEPGELWLRSEVVTPGYWGKPAETRAVMSDGWFRTGDVVRRDPDGFYYVVDRKKNMFISGGENVYPAEVEHVLVKHPAVKEAAVIGVPDQRWGEVGLAFLVPHPGHIAPDAEALRAFCLDKLARYKIPKHVRILPALPLNQAGKIDRLRLVELESPPSLGG
jgi:fatty-acyl-CoA synthase